MTTTAHRPHHGGSPRRLTTFDVATAALGLWGLLWPNPLALCVVVLALAPPICIAIALASHGEISLNDRKWGQVRPSLGGALFVASLALAARGALDVPLVDWRLPLAAAGGLGLLFLAAALLAEPEFRRPLMVVFVLPIGLAWGWGLVVEADAFLDRGGWTTYSVTVLDKQVTGLRSRGGPPQHYFVVGPSAVPGLQGRLRVGRRLYLNTEIGTKVCAEVAPGRFGWPWYNVKACP